MEFNFKVTPNCNAFYKNGIDFLKSAERCLGMDSEGKVTIIDNGILKTLPVPAVVNTTIACEMFLKALILKSGNSCPKDKNGHNLKYLFEILPTSMKEKIIQFCVKTETEQFDSFLSEHSRDFISVRYYVENEGWQGMSPFIVYTYTYNICNITKYLLDNWEADSNG